MKKVEFIVIFFVTILYNVYCVPQSALCCPQEQYILTGKNNTHKCWEPKSNTTMLVTLKCDKKAGIPENLYNFTVNDEGYINFFLPNNQEEMKPGTFCVGHKVKSADVKLIVNATRLAVICNEEDISSDYSTIMAYCMLFSAVFLFMTAIIYSILSELRDLQGKSIINFCISLALGLTCLSVMNLFSSYADMKLCATRGFLTYFFFIVSFFWTNAISIQILRSMRRSLLLDYGWREFIWYALYCWGSGTLLTIAMAIVNFYPGEHQKPGIGLNHCWFFNKRQQWYYMYSVMTILIAANVCIFIYTSILLWRQTFASSHIKAVKYKFIMTIRLIVIMGLPWIFEMLGSILESYNIIWIILDFFNVLQGPLIFLILVVLRRRVLKAMLKRGILDCISAPLERHLAVGDDDEDNVIQHTMDVPMDEKFTT